MGTATLSKHRKVFYGGLKPEDALIKQKGGLTKKALIRLAEFEEKEGIPITQMIPPRADVNKKTNNVKEDTGSGDVMPVLRELGAEEARKAENMLAEAHKLLEGGYEKNKYAEAKRIFERIRDSYPDTKYSDSAKKYIALTLKSIALRTLIKEASSINESEKRRSLEEDGNKNKSITTGSAVLKGIEDQVLEELKKCPDESLKTWQIAQRFGGDTKEVAAACRSLAKKGRLKKVSRHAEMYQLMPPCEKAESVSSGPKEKEPRQWKTAKTLADKTYDAGISIPVDTDVVAETVIGLQVADEKSIRHLGTKMLRDLKSRQNLREILSKRDIRTIMATALQQSDAGKAASEILFRIRLLDAEYFASEYREFARELGNAGRCATADYVTKTLKAKYTRNRLNLVFYRIMLDLEMEKGMFVEEISSKKIISPETLLEVRVIAEGRSYNSMKLSRETGIEEKYFHYVLALLTAHESVRWFVKELYETDESFRSIKKIRGSKVTGLATPLLQSIGLITRREGKYYVNESNKAALRQCFPDVFEGVSIREAWKDKLKEDARSGIEKRIQERLNGKNSSGKHAESASSETLEQVHKDDYNSSMALSGLEEYEKGKIPGSLDDRKGSRTPGLGVIDYKSVLSLFSEGLRDAASARIGYLDKRLDSALEQVDEEGRWNASYNKSVVEEIIRGLDSLGVEARETAMEGFKWNLNSRMLEAEAEAFANDFFSGKMDYGKLPDNEALFNALFFTRMLVVDGRLRSYADICYGGDVLLERGNYVTYASGERQEVPQVSRSMHRQHSFPFGHGTSLVIEGAGGSAGEPRVRLDVVPRAAGINLGYVITQLVHAYGGHATLYRIPRYNCIDREVREGIASYRMNEILKRIQAQGYNSLGLARDLAKELGLVEMHPTKYGAYYLSYAEVLKEVTEKISWGWDQATRLFVQECPTKEDFIELANGLWNGTVSVGSLTYDRYSIGITSSRYAAKGTNYSTEEMDHGRLGGLFGHIGEKNLSEARSIHESGDAIRLEPGHLLALAMMRSGLKEGDPFSSELDGLIGWLVNERKDVAADVVSQIDLHDLGQLTAAGIILEYLEKPYAADGRTPAKKGMDDILDHFRGNAKIIDVYPALPSRFGITENGVLNKDPAELKIGEVKELLLGVAFYMRLSWLGNEPFIRLKKALSKLYETNPSVFGELIQSALTGMIDEGYDPGIVGEIGYHLSPIYQEAYENNHIDVIDDDCDGLRWHSSLFKVYAAQSNPALLAVRLNEVHNALAYCSIDHTTGVASDKKAGKTAYYRLRFAALSKGLEHIESDYFTPAYQLDKAERLLEEGQHNGPEYLAIKAFIHASRGEMGKATELYKRSELTLETLSAKMGDWVTPKELEEIYWILSNSDD
jgi:hypothetical protein